MFTDFDMRTKLKWTQRNFFRRKTEHSVSILPVDYKPGHGQYAGHPGAAHHPAAHKQGRDIDSLQAKDRSNVEVNWFHNILERKWSIRD